MLITFLKTTTPKEIFYNGATKSYGFFNDSNDSDDFDDLGDLQKLHGLLELETESVKNLTWAYIRNQTELMFHGRPVIWNEEALNELKETLNESPKEYWKDVGESVIEGFWKTAKEAEAADSYDKTRKMYQDASHIKDLLTWSSYKNREEAMVKTISELSFDTKTPEKILDLLQKLQKLKSDSKFDDRYRSAEIQKIQEILEGVSGNKFTQWENEMRSLSYEMSHRKMYKEKITGLMKKLKPPQEERLEELISLKKIEQNLEDKESIDTNTWQEIKELLSMEEKLEKSLPQMDQTKKNFLKKLEELVSSNGQTQPQTFEEVNRIRNEISKIFQNSIEDALNQGNSGNNGQSISDILKQMENDIVELAYQSRWNPNMFTGLFPSQNIATDSQSWEEQLGGKSSNILQAILNSIDKDLIDKLKGLATNYNNRVSGENYQKLRDFVRKNEGPQFEEILTLDKDVNRLQSVFTAISRVGDVAPKFIRFFDHKNFNMENTVVIYMLDNKFPLAVKFKDEVKEVIKLIFQKYEIDETAIASFLNDLEKIIDVLVKPDSIQSILTKEQEELEYFRAVIEDFRDTKRDLDASIFKEFSSWKKIFQGKNLNVEGNILQDLTNSLTFANGIDSINFYAANEYVRLALVYSLPLRPEISSQQKKEAKLPDSKDPKKIRQEMQKIFNYGLQEKKNNQAKLEENKKTIQKILKLLHEAKLVNFTEDKNGEIDVFHSYSKFVRIAIKVWDRDYELPLHRTTNYHCRIEYVGNGKPNNNNTVQRVEEF
jgi:hypothetical protein